MPMNTAIRMMKPEDKPQVLAMMRDFYRSDAEWTNGSPEIFENDIDQCIQNSPYLEGYILENDQGIQGYAMIAKSFSTEFGKPCIWIEDLYILEPHRGQGIGQGFFRFITEKYAGCLFRLEVVEENHRAIHVYEKCGFTKLPYLEMKK